VSHLLSFLEEAGWDLCAGLAPEAIAELEVERGAGFPSIIREVLLHRMP